MLGALLGDLSRHPVVRRLNLPLVRLGVGQSLFHRGHTLGELGYCFGSAFGSAGFSLARSVARWLDRGASGFA